MKSLPPQCTAPEVLINNINTANIRCTVNVKALGFLDDTQQVTTKHGVKQLRTAIVADSSGIMKLPLWERNIHKISTGKSYCIKNVLSSTFASETRLKTTIETSFIPIPELENVKEDISNLDTTSEVKGTVVSCRFVVTFKYVHCKKPLDNEEKQQMCRCESCGSRQRMLPQNQTKTLHLQMINTHQEEVKFVAFTDVVNQYMQTKDLSDKSASEDEEFILPQPEIIVKHDQKSDVAISLSLLN